MYIEKIDSPKDLKKLNIDQCVILADEIRHALLHAVSETGGHLSSNLGIVDATIALHYVFDSPQDKIIFDTSHQCYTHKMLTGRKDAYLEPGRYKKYSGYTNPDESVHDYFKLGHTSTSISLACGLAKARDLRGDKENVIAVIGDGSLSGGEAFEGLNFGGSEIKGNLIILFNDNQMSIAENHGGMYGSLNALCMSNGGAANNIFRFLGYDYRYVGDGNDITNLISMFQQVKDIDHPIVLHMCTVKGKGYDVSEEKKEETHFVKPFNLKLGDIRKKIVGERYDLIIRDFLLEKMRADRNVVIMTAAMPVTLSLSEELREQIGEQYIDVGIAEEHAISMAGGIARNGGKPVFFTRSTFFQRTYDQISQDICINKLPITMILINSSVYAATDMTHIGIFDIAMMSNIPNLVMLAPTNKEEYLAMLDWSIEQNEHPVAIRPPRNGIYHADYEVDRDYGVLNKFQMMIQGEEIAVIALGDFYQLGEEVVKMIRDKIHVNASLINPRYASGIDEKLLGELSEAHRIIITLEDGILEGGFGQKISAFYGNTKVRVLNYGLNKEFVDFYDTEAVLIRNRLKPEMIVENVASLMRR